MDKTNSPGSRFSGIEVGFLGSRQTMEIDGRKRRKILAMNRKKRRKEAYDALTFRSSFRNA